MTVHFSSLNVDGYLKTLPDGSSTHSTISYILIVDITSHKNTIGAHDCKHNDTTPFYSALARMRYEDSIVSSGYNLWKPYIFHKIMYITVNSRYLTVILFLSK